MRPRCRTALGTKNPARVIPRAGDGPADGDGDAERDGLHLTDLVADVRRGVLDEVVAASA